MIRLTDLISELVEEESAAAKQAKSLGLTSIGFGRWADKSGKVTHTSKDGKLVATKPQDATTSTSNTKAKSTTTPQDKVKANTPPVQTNKTKSVTPTPEQPKTPAVPTHSSVSKGTVPYKKTGNIYRSVSDSIESSGFSSMNSADSKALIKNGMVPLRVKGASPRTWRRGDGAQHKEWTTIEPANDWRGVDKVVKIDPSAVSKTLSSYIEKIGAKQIGQVSGEFGSSKMNDVYAAGDTIFVHRGNRIDVGNKKRFANTKVWRKP